jgi:zinc transporter 1/2/3
MFGIGVIASSAWMHLLPEAYETFTNPCVNLNGPITGSFMVGFLGMVAGFGVQVIEIFAMGHSDKELGRSCQDSKRHLDSIAPSRGHAAHEEETHVVKRNGDATTTNNMSSVIVNGSLETDSRRSFDGDILSNSEIHLRENTITADRESIISPMTDFETHLEVFHTVPFALASPDATLETTTYHNTFANQHISIIILESGILFHSIIIGLTLGVTPDADFLILLVAIGFHQLFEGMALGVMISNLDLKFTTKFFVLGLLYPLTTPLGIVVGILVRETYNGNSQSLLLLQGVLNSLSAGILMYNVYAELMSVEINHNAVFIKFSKGFKFACFMAMYVGAIVLAILAVWA